MTRDAVLKATELEGGMGKVANEKANVQRLFKNHAQMLSGDDISVIDKSIADAYDKLAANLKADYDSLSGNYQAPIVKQPAKAKEAKK